MYLRYSAARAALVGSGMSRHKGMLIMTLVIVNRRVRSEIVRVYRELRAGEIEPALASKLIYSLTELSRLIEREAVEALEARLAAVERGRCQEPDRARRAPEREKAAAPGHLPAVFHRQAHNRVQGLQCHDRAEAWRGL